MKFVITSDWHLDWTTHGVRRFEDLEESVYVVRDRAIEENAHFVFAGDLANPDSGSCTFRVLNLALSVAIDLARKGLQSFWIAGNHDVIEDGSGDTTLTPLRALNPEMVHVIERPRMAVASSRTDRVLVFGLPFTASSHRYDPEEAIDAMAKQAHSTDRVLVVSHLHVEGVEPGEETTEMPRGRAEWLPVPRAKEVAKVVVNGHYHRAQLTKSGVLIPGSLARLTFCEERHDPAFLVVNV